MAATLSVVVSTNSMFKEFDHLSSLYRLDYGLYTPSGDTEGESITVPLTSCLTSSDKSVL